MSTVELSDLVTRLEAVVQRLESKGPSGAGAGGDGNVAGE